MARTKSTTAPPAVPSVALAPRPAPEVPRAPVEVERLELVAIEVPHVATSKYAAREIDMRLDAGQAATLRAILEGLQQRCDRTADGHHVESPRDAVRWLIEAVGRTWRASRTARGLPLTVLGSAAR